MTARLNEISNMPDNFILVLDDYHIIDIEVVDAPTSIAGALIFLLEHVLPHMHLVLSSREDLDLPLARLRARGRLSALHTADLRFTPAEDDGADPEQNLEDVLNPARLLLGADS